MFINDIKNILYVWNIHYDILPTYGQVVYMLYVQKHFFNTTYGHLVYILYGHRVFSIKKYVQLVHMWYGKKPYVHKHMDKLYIWCMDITFCPYNICTNCLYDVWTETFCPYNKQTNCPYVVCRTTFPLCIY